MSTKSKHKWKVVWSDYRASQRRVWSQLRYLRCGDDDALLDSWSDQQIEWYKRHPALRVASNRHMGDYLSLK